MLEGPIASHDGQLARRISRCVVEVHGPEFDYCCWLNALDYLILVLDGQHPKIWVHMESRRAQPCKVPQI